MTLDFSRAMWFVFASAIIITWLKHSIFKNIYKLNEELGLFSDSFLAWQVGQFYFNFWLQSFSMVCSLVSSVCPYLPSIIAWIYIPLNPMHPCTFMLPVICNKQGLTNTFPSGSSKSEIQHGDINASLYFLSPWRSEEAPENWENLLYKL